MPLPPQPANTPQAVRPVAEGHGRPQSTFLSRLAGTLIAVFAAGLFAAPLILVIVSKAEYLFVGQESLGYRYFACARIWGGDRASVVLPQGQLLSTIQQAIWGFMNLLGIQDLRQRMQFFGLATSAFVDLAAAVLFTAVGLSRTMRVTDKLLVAFTALAPVFAVTPGIFYATTADYYYVDVLLGSAAVGLFLWQFRAGRGRPVLVGVFCGLVAANKISMLAVAIPNVGAAFTGCKNWRVRRRTAARLAIASAATALAIFIAFHGFDPFTFVRLIPRWIGLMSMLGAETQFWQNLGANLRSYHYDLIGACWIAVILFSGVGAVRSVVRNERPRRTLGLFGCAVLAGILPWAGILRRPANTTLFEACIAVVVSSAVAISVGTVRARWTAILLAAWSAIGVYTTISFWPIYYRTLQDSGPLADQAWSFHEAVYRRHKHVVFLVKDNEYRWPGIEIAVMKGLSEIPTWRIRTAKPLFKQILPDTEFRVEFDRVPLPAGILIWRDTVSEGAGRPAGPSLQKDYQPLAAALARQGAKCGPAPGALGAEYDVHICEVPPDGVVEDAPPTTELEPALNEIRSMVDRLRREKRIPNFSNVYGVQAYAAPYPSPSGAARVLYYPNVPRAHCIQLMLRLDGAVSGIGIDGHSPGWRTDVTPEIAKSDCGGVRDQMNFLVGPER